MEQKIIKQGDFTLKHFDYNDSYVLFYKDSPAWKGNFNKLFDTELRDCMFEKEPDPKEAAKFITKLYDWGFSKKGAIEKMLEEVYG